MPTNTGSRLWGRLADAFIPGNVYNNTTNRWNPATLKTGIAGMVAGQFVPGGEMLVNKAARMGAFGQGHAHQMQSETYGNQLADQYGAYKREQGKVADGLNPGVQVPNASYTPSWGRPSMSAPSQPASLAQMVAPQQALPQGVSGVQRQAIPVPQAQLQVGDMQMSPGLNIGRPNVAHQFGGGYGGSAVGGFAYNSNPYAGAITGDAAQAYMGAYGSRRGAGVGGADGTAFDSYIDLM